MKIKKKQHNWIKRNSDKEAVIDAVTSATGLKRLDVDNVISDYEALISSLVAKNLSIKYSLFIPSVGTIHAQTKNGGNRLHQNTLLSITFNEVFVRISNN